MQKVITQDIIDKMLELHKRGMECNAIAQEIGIEEEIVLKYVNKKKTTSKINDEKIAKMLELKKQGLSTSQIASELGIGKTSVNKYLRIYSDEELGNTSKFSKDIVEEAIKEYKNGKTIQQIAKEKGVSSSSLSIYLYKYERANKGAIKIDTKGIEEPTLDDDNKVIEEESYTKGVPVEDNLKESTNNSEIVEEFKIDVKKEHGLRLSRLKKKVKKTHYRFTKLNTENRVKLREVIKKEDITVTRDKETEVKPKEEIKSNKIKESKVVIQENIQSNKAKETEVKSKEEIKSNNDKEQELVQNKEDIDLLNRMLNLYKEGYSLTEIGKQVNLSRSTVTRRIYKALGITKNKDIKVVPSNNVIPTIKETKVEDTKKQVIEDKEIETESMKIIQKEEIDIEVFKSILEEIKGTINQDDKFTLEDKIEYCNKKYGEGKWRFLTKKDIMYYLKLDGIIS